MQELERALELQQQAAQQQQEAMQRQVGEGAAAAAGLLAAAQAQAAAAQEHCTQMTQQLQAISDHSMALHLQVSADTQPSMLEIAHQ